VRYSVVGVRFGAGNYYDHLWFGGVTINQAPLTITASDQSKVYGTTTGTRFWFGSVGLYEQRFW